MNIENRLRRLNEEDKTELINKFVDFVISDNSYLKRIKSERVIIEENKGSVLLNCGGMGICVEGNKITTHT